MLFLSNAQQDLEPLPLILPGSLEYLLAEQDLGLFPGAMDLIHQKSGELAFICRPGGGGMLEAVSLEEFAEYCNDGEGDLRQAELKAQWELEDSLLAEQWA